MSIFTKVFGDPNQRVLKELRQVAEQVNSLEGQIKKLSDQELSQQTLKFKERLAKGETLDDLLPEAFATVREASFRVINQRHFDVQLMGGVALHRGQIAEMRTGEGKTLVATLPLYLNALTGKGAHLVTVNDYLARVGAGWMGPVFAALGLTTSVIVHEQAFIYDPTANLSGVDDRLKHFRLVSRREAYLADITYGTNNEFGFDYLRDNMVAELNQMAQRELNYAIVDEVDSILIDEARTPLIISAPDEESGEMYKRLSQVVTRLKESVDYNIDEKMKAATFTEEGLKNVEQALSSGNLANNQQLYFYATVALRAMALFRRDKDYVVKDDEIIIVDEFTGRLMPGRRYSEGLHQALEAKEGVTVQKESKTLATISFQNFFRLYQKLAGMTGTAATEAEEFHKIYKLEVVPIPTNQPMVRQDLADRIYKTENGKFLALVQEIKARHEQGQPVLVGTISIEKNEILSQLLEREGLSCQVLNAKQHEKEAQIIADAGKRGAVTVATNMAGRGVDIILGGAMPNEEADLALWQKEHEAVVAAGGLCVLGTERHESRRIDNQLRGRAGRQGDSGVSQFYLSLEDDLLRIFGSERLKGLMTTLGVPEDMPIETGMVSRAIEQAQKKVEGNNFDIRKHLVEYDDVMNKQREIIYKKRKEILVKENLKEDILALIEKEIFQVVAFHTADEQEQNWNLEEIYEVVNTIFAVSATVRLKLNQIQDLGGNELENLSAREQLTWYLVKLATQHYNQLEQAINQSDFGQALNGQLMNRYAKQIYLQAIDNLWIDHLETIDHLRAGINLRGYGQRDPLIEYKREGYQMFNELLGAIQKQVVYAIYKVALAQSQALSVNTQSKNLQFSAPAKEATSTGSPFAQEVNSRQEAGQKIEDKNHYNNQKVGRNDSCPCGSGKKYKQCHGK
ncbi:MAG: preprotein translocase subunit SecA [Candidatus Buchananbacteria bacterium]